MNRVSSILNINYSYNQNIYGRNIGVAILDTGISVHNDFVLPNNRIVAFHNCISNTSTPYDDNGHGTHVSSIIGGNGYSSKNKYHGVAPLCNIISVKVLNSKGTGKLSAIKDALEWVIDNKDTYNIRIVNISIGAEFKNTPDNHLLINYVENAWDNGLILLTAAGNLGPKPNTITVPGISKKIITVGTLEEYLNISANNKSYSSTGPTHNNIIKPEILAPGNNIMACSNSLSGYTRKSGTSMATPVVSGAIALLLEKNPSLTNKDVKILLHKTSTLLDTPKNRQGWGLINIPSLLENG